MREMGIVEAALFSAGRVVSAEEIAAATKLPVDRVREGLHALAKVYDDRDSAIEVARIGDKWTIQIRDEYAERAQPFAPPEVPRDLLKTLSLIAYHQPLKQSTLFDMIGSKVYEHTQALEQLRLISRTVAGRTFDLATTRYFTEFFGVRTTDRDGIRLLLAGRVGVTNVEPRKPEVPTVTEAPAEGPAVPDAEGAPADASAPDDPITSA